MTLKTLLLALFVFAFTSVGMAEDTRQPVPVSQCDGFGLAAQAICVVTLKAEVEAEGGVIDPNAANNIRSICSAAKGIGEVVCKQSAVKLDRSSGAAFCDDLSASFAALSSLGCEAVVEEGKDLNSPEAYQTMLQTCKQLGADVRKHYAPACLKRYQGGAPTNPPEPKVKPNPKAPPSPPPFKTREEALSV